MNGIQRSGRHAAACGLALGLLAAWPLAHGTGGSADADRAGPMRDSAVALKVMHAFDGSAGGNPDSALVVGSDGKLHGTTAGFAFRMTASGHVTWLHPFTKHDGQGAQGQVQASDGQYYGNARWMGRHGCGTVYRMKKHGALTVLHAFDCGFDEGRNPNGRLAQADDGAFYGVTNYGGATDQGTVFRVTRHGRLSVVHVFAKDGFDGILPETGPIRASDGLLYGTTTEGGNGAGTVYRIGSDGSYAQLYAFVWGLEDPRRPESPLVEAADGGFYGTTRYGGPDAAGTVYRLSKDGALTLIHAFARDGVDGDYPSGSLVRGSDGWIYGVTKYGGRHGQGTIFRVGSGGVYEVLHAFSRHAHDGAVHPQSGLVELADGEFYGTTLEGGAFGYGTIYRIRLKQCSQRDVAALSGAGCADDAVAGSKP